MFSPRGVQIAPADKIRNEDAPIMTMQELRGLSVDELKAKEKSIKEELFKLNAQRFSGRIDKPHMLGVLRKDIARIQTILKEKKE